jgi:hypothetical protein
MTKLHCHLGKRLTAAVGIAAVVVVAVMMVGPASASAKTKFDYLKGSCAVPGRFNQNHSHVFGSVGFSARNGDGYVEVYDLCTDGWSIEAELFWGGEQRRPRKTCWAVRSGANTCHVEIREGTRVWVYIAQAKRSTCDDPKSDPSVGCDKNHWKLAFVATA